MTEETYTTSKQDGKFHTYSSSHIPWYIRAMWICFWLGGFWYVVKFAIPNAKNYF